MNRPAASVSDRFHGSSTLNCCMPLLQVVVAMFACVGLLAATVQAGDAFDTGHAAYRSKCANCHGEDGQGVSGAYESALAGQRSVGELTRLIERTMPQEHPEECVGEEARQVAAFIYDDFYSPAARQRKGLDPPLHVELMRLTVPQYQNAVADLIGYFTPSVAVSKQVNSEGEPRRRRETDAPANADGTAKVEASGDQVQPGLRAAYFSSKGMSKADQLSFERIDTRLEFDFQEAAPAEDIPTDQFSIIWEGTLSAHDTGEYQFRITTPNGARLYLNDDPARGLRKLRDDSSAAGQSALIDAWVSSRKLREESGRAFLLGGREYPIRIEFFKYQEPTASIKVEWKPPHGTWSVLDARCLSTRETSRTFVLTTPFPADDRSLGYERGSSISNEWQSAVATAAIHAAAEMIDRIELLADDHDDHDDKSDNGQQGDAEPAQPGEPSASAADADDAERAKLQSFVTRLAGVAFRRTLSPDESARIQESFFTRDVAPEAAARRAIVWILCSPEFIYADLSDPILPPSPRSVATRLSLALWDSIPDAKLLAAADAGELQTAEQIEQAARRMLVDPRAKHKVRGFFHHWLELDDRDLSKDKQLFPDFDEVTIAALRESLEQFLDEVVWSDASDYRQLLSADYLLLNEPLLRMYMIDPADANLANKAGDTPSSDRAAGTAKDSDTRQDSIAGEEIAGEPTSADATSNEANSHDKIATSDVTEPDEFQRVVLRDQQRAGVLTHPYLLSAFAYHNNTSPIHRGVFLTRNVVGRALKPPPIAVAFKNDEFAADLTMREKITQLTSDSACMACHSVINPLGFALENYDAVGRWRTFEKTKPINAHSPYTTENGEQVDIRSATDIAQLALSSESAHRAFVVQLFEHLTKQNPAAYGPNTAEDLRAKFEADQYNIQNLMVRIAVMAAMHHQSPASVPADTSAAASTSASE